MSVTKLEKLNPTDKTIKLSVDTEEQAIEKIQEHIKNGDFNLEVVNTLNRFLSTVGKMRINQRAEISIKARIFRDISENKTELKAYIKASFPGLKIK